MPATKSYVNEIVEREVSLAIEQLFIAPVATAAPAVARVSVASPPSGYIHLGSVVEDSPTLTITRDKYQLSTGLPSILQFDAVVGITGQFAMSFYSNSNRIVEYALGGMARQYTVSTVSSISTATSRTQVTLNAVTGFSIGDVVAVHATSAGLANNEAEITSVAGSNVLHFSGAGLQTPPVVADKIGKVTAVELVFGTTRLPRYYLIGVADFLDGVQVQHHFPKVTPVGEFTENIQPGQAPIVAGSWDIYAQDGGAQWSNEFILGRRVTIPKLQ